MLSKIDKDEYRENLGKVCPYCGNESVITSSRKEELKVINNDRSLQEMKCTKCKKHWKEVYPIFDIEELEDNDND